MASVTLKPDPQKFPVGTVLKLFAKPSTPWAESGQPPGAVLSEGTVEAAGANSQVTFTGVTEGSSYVAWAAGANYLRFTVRVEAASAGISKAEVEALIAEKAVSTDSPTFTGTPSAPTPAESDNSTKLATTKYADRAVAVEKTRAEAAELLKAPLASPALTGVPKAPTAAPGANSTQLATTAYADAIAALAPLKANNLSDLANAGTARTNLGLGTAATTAASAYEVAGAAATAQAAAEAASGLHMAVHASVVTNGTTGTVNQLHPVNDEAESRTIKLPTGQVAGSRIAFEKSSAAAFEVAVEGSIRGEAAQTIKLRLSKQTVLFVADASGSWWPIALYVPLATLTTEYIQRTIFFPPGTVPPNEIIGAWEVHLFGTEKRTIVRARVRTSSGTIKVAITRGTTGATEIAAYKALAAAETQEVVESEQALSDKDRITVTASAGFSPKGLAVDIWEKVEK